MAMEAPQPPRSGADAWSSADRLRGRVAEARASISQSLRNVVDGIELEYAQERQRSADRIDEMVAERLATAERELSIRFDVGIERARAELDQGLVDRVDQLVADAASSLQRSNDEAIRKLISDRGLELSAGIEERSQAALAAIGEAEAKVTGRLEEATDKFSRKSRRRDRKLARKESSKRIEKALARLEEGVERVDGALVQITASERQVAAAQARVGTVEGRVADAARLAAEVSAWETRIHRATAASDDAARRMDEAEQRLLATLQADRLEARRASA